MYFYTLLAHKVVTNDYETLGEKPMYTATLEEEIARAERIKPIKSELQQYCRSHENKKFFKLADTIFNWRQVMNPDGRYPNTIADLILESSISSANPEIFDFTFLRASDTIKKDPYTFRTALTEGTPDMLTALIDANPSLLKEKPYDQNLFASVINHLTTNALIRNGQFEDKEVEKMVQDWNKTVPVQFPADKANSFDDL